MNSASNISILAGPKVRIHTSTYDDRYPILSFGDDGLHLQVSNGTLTPAQAEVLADRLMTAAIEFAEATKRETARLRREQGIEVSK